MIQLTPEQVNILFGAILAGIFAIIGTLSGVILASILQGKLERDKDRKLSAETLLSDASKFITEAYKIQIIIGDKATSLKHKAKSEENTIRTQKIVT